ncbi:hypothetical protein LXL04_009187 [Taraxacum kok-saghyz]
MIRIFNPLSQSSRCEIINLIDTFPFRGNMESVYAPVPKESFVELQLNDNRNYDYQNPEFSEKKTYIRNDDGEELVTRRIDSLEIGGDDDDIDDIDYDSSRLAENSNSGVYGAVFNLTTTVIGAGLMALPATMKVLGLVVGVIMIFVMGILSEISVELLVRFTVQCKALSYGEVVEQALGKPAKILSEICIILNNAGVLVVYLIIMGDVMSGSENHMGVFDQWLGNGFWDHRKLLILIVLIIFLAPLCVLDRIDSLSVTSAASVALAIVFVVVAFAVAFIKLVRGEIAPPRMTPDFGSEKAILDLLVVIPIMSNAFVCHFNLQPIYNELEGRSPPKMNRVGRITTVLCILVYCSTAISGYLLFGNDTESDVLTNFDKPLGEEFSTVINYIVRVGYILHLVLVFPVIHFSLRQTVDALAFEGAAPLHESRKRCLVLTFTLLALIFIGSTSIPSIWTAFKFTGATTAVSLGYTFPALIALKLGGHALTKRVIRVMSSSFFFSGVGLGRNLLEHWNHEDSRFWDDCWVGHRPLRMVFPRLVILDANQNCLAADRWVDGAWRWQWQRSILGGRTLASLQDLMLLLGDVRLTDCRDGWKWEIASDGVFSVAETRRWIDDHILPEGVISTRWCNVVPRKGLDIPSIMCPLCGSEPETVDHVFWRCGVARDIWVAMFRWLQLPPGSLDHPSEVFDWIDDSRGSSNRRLVIEAVVCSAFWMILRFRNDVVHESRKMRKDMLVDFIKDFAFVWISNRCCETASQPVVGYRPPATGATFKFSPSSLPSRFPVVVAVFTDPTVRLRLHHSFFSLQRPLFSTSSSPLQVRVLLNVAEIPVFADDDDGDCAEVAGVGEGQSKETGKRKIEIRVNSCRVRV